MATYPMPACGLSTSSSVALVDGLTTGRLGDGTAFGVSLWTNPKQKWTLVHDYCTWAEWEAIRASYAANRAAVAGSMTFTWPLDSLTKTARWVAEPTCRGSSNDGTRMVVTSQLEEV